MTDTVHAAAVVASGPSSPSFRVRALLPGRELERHGIEVKPRPLFSDEEYRRFQRASGARRVQLLLRARRRLADVVRNGGEVEVVTVHRQADMLPSLSLERLLSQGRRLIYDVDDAVWADARGLSGGHRLAALKGSRRKARWLAHAADHVVAGNEVLAEWLSPYSRRLTVVPSLVETRGWPVRAHADGEAIVLGWIGSRTTARYLSRLRQPLEELSAAVSRPVRLLVVGGGMRAPAGVVVESVPWSEAAEREALLRMDVGLMPLPDNEWTRGKCSYKALQYMAAGVPVVTDDVGMSGSVVVDGQGGLIARRPEDWTAYISALAGDAEQRKRMGAFGRERVQQDFSVERWAPVLASILRGA